MRGSRVKTIKRWLEERGVTPTRRVRRLAAKVYKRAGRSGLNACLATGVFERAASIASPEVQRVLTLDVLRAKRMRRLDRAAARDLKPEGKPSLGAGIKVEATKKNWMGRLVQKLLRAT